MPFARSSAARHILYMWVSLASALSMSACADREEAESESRGSRGQPGEASEQGATGAKARADSIPLSASSADQGAVDSTLDRAANGADAGAETTDDGARRSWRGRKGRPIEIILRSSPPGAVAAVDGVTLGPTPSIWEGVADATAREFSFVLPGYAVARYRFVPTRSGIVHGKLEPIKAEAADAAPKRPPSNRQADTR